MNAQKLSVLVTGAAGFIGQHIVSEMAACGWAVIGLDQRSFSKALFLQQKITEWHEVTLPSPDLERLLARLHPNALIHVAGPASVPMSMRDPAIDFSLSVPVFFQILDAVRRHAPECRIIFLSSAAVYGNPTKLPITEDASLQPISPYGFHKLICEKLAEEFQGLYKVRVCSIRIFSAYGPSLRQQVLWDICQKALHEPVVKLLGNGEETRDFIHVNDIAKAVAYLVTREVFLVNTYNLGSGEETSIHRLAKILLAALGQSKEIRFTSTRREGDPLRWQADMTLLSRLGYHPLISLAEGATEYARWFLEDVKKHGLE